MELTPSLSGEVPRDSVKKRLSVAGLGQCSLDFLCTVERYPASDSKCEFQEFSIQGGGPVATALALLARWGVSARFAGLICEDHFGRLIRCGTVSRSRRYSTFAATRHQFTARDQYC